MVVCEVTVAPFTVVVVPDGKSAALRSRTAYLLSSIKELVLALAPDVPPSRNVAAALSPSQFSTTMVAAARFDDASVVSVILGEAVPNVLVVNGAERASCCSTTPPT